MNTGDNDFFHRKYANRAAEIFGITEWQNDINLIRLYQKLHVLVGGNESNMRHWIQTPNKHLDNKVPANLIVEQKGMIRVLDYLDYFISE